MRLIAGSLLALFVASTTPAAAAQLGVELSGGASVPGEQFGESITGGGYAVVGYAAMANVFGPLPGVGGLQWMISGGVASHGVDPLLGRGFASGSGDASVYRYLTIPALAGVRFPIPIGESVAAHIEVQPGLIFHRKGSIKTDAEDITFDMVSKFSVVFGAGLDFTRRVGVGLRLVAPGKMTISGTSSLTGAVETERRISYTDWYLKLRLF